MVPFDAVPGVSVIVMFFRGTGLARLDLLIRLDDLGDASSSSIRSTSLSLILDRLREALEILVLFIVIRVCVFSGVVSEADLLLETVEFLERLDPFSEELLLVLTEMSGETGWEP
uniref:Uncharacterized protein n=1 Tax=Pararge aegeria TaxID=116150 RepID=S4PVN0_9NEOP